MLSHPQIARDLRQGLAAHQTGTQPRQRAFVGVRMRIV